MNVPRAIEIAVASILRTAELGEGVVIRAWQSLASDAAWNKNKDRSFPVVDVRCGPPQMDDNAHTCFCDCTVLCGTKADDDKDHAEISALYGEVQGIVDRLYGEYWNTSGGLRAEFEAILAGELGPAFNGVGGLTQETPQAPFIADGINMIGLTVRVHFSRNDY